MSCCCERLDGRQWKNSQHCQLNQPTEQHNFTLTTIPTNDHVHTSNARRSACVLNIQILLPCSATFEVTGRRCGFSQSDGWETGGARRGLVSRLWGGVVVALNATVEPQQQYQNLHD
ncbi:hypothetical protein T4E_2015 [Trichinella pseudospiralis]|uniref:Uncharacterized protein n=1 Tax=Trichinella pseudospiralis TaxID=6337 RepID=A0A0V0XZ62_TRIPS|nr:hypothetical protein T4E_2015 [Trichinella pseudospiralis]